MHMRNKIIHRKQDIVVEQITRKQKTRFVRYLTTSTINNNRKQHTYRRTNAVGPTAQHHHSTSATTASTWLIALFRNAWNRCLHLALLTAHGHIVLGGIVGHVEVVGLGRVLRGQGVDLLGVRGDVELLAATAHDHLCRRGVTGDLAVTEACNLYKEREKK